MKPFYFIIGVFSILFSSLFAEQSNTPTVLVEGTLRVAGIPGFGPNSIPALFGSYQFSDENLVLVYAVSEPLLFNPALWINERSKTLKLDFQRSLAGGDTQIWVTEVRIFMRSEMNDLSRWYFVYVFKPETDESLRAQFIQSFQDRVQFYFSSVKTPADLSFPAILQLVNEKKKR